ncbi:hypothetical protein X975_21404, partial [Stegodyphus mimosarum]
MHTLIECLLHLFVSYVYTSRKIHIKASKNVLNIKFSINEIKEEEKALRNIKDLLDDISTDKTKVLFPCF